MMKLLQSKEKLLVKQFFANFISFLNLQLKIMVLSFNLKLMKAGLLYGILGRKITYNQIKESRFQYFGFIY
jgi:hypothetical protein